MSVPGRSLVVGAAGQVGHQIVEALGLGNTLCAGRSVRPGWLQVNLAELANSPENLDEIFEQYEIDAVYCVGGATDVERCEADTEWAMQTNHLGPAALASRCTHIPFIYFSTEYVFDGLDGPYTETSEKNPVSVYGLSKSLGEEAVLRMHSTALVLRTTVVYGEDPGGKNFLYSLRRNLASGQTISVPVDQFSTPTYNRDLARATIALVHASRYGIFHICGPELLSRYDFAVQAALEMKLDSRMLRGVVTSDLAQKAKRPLRAGLLTEKLTQSVPEVRMRTVAEGIDDWLGQD